nr:MAG TPA: hypothetical protein [Caudoviricetes sp.]
MLPCPVDAERLTGKKVWVNHSTPTVRPETWGRRWSPRSSDSRGSYLLRTERIHRAARMGRGRCPVNIAFSMEYAGASGGVAPELVRFQSTPPDRIFTRK